MAADLIAPDAVWLIYFDDYDRRPEIVVGEVAARHRFAQISDNWNAHLFVKVESNSRDDKYAKANLPAGVGAPAPAKPFDDDWAPNPNDDQGDVGMAPCNLCAKGFPVQDGHHYGTQALGMIPWTPCAAGVKGNDDGL